MYFRRFFLLPLHLIFNQTHELRRLTSLVYGS